MKKLLLLLLAFSILVIGCGKEDTTPENTQSQENTQTQQNDFSTAEGSNPYEDYITSIKESSDILKEALEQDDTLTQAQLNEKSQELYELWDDALNYLWAQLKGTLPEDDFEKLLTEQRSWISQKESDVEAAAKDYEGGSIYALVKNMEAAKITEARVYELYDLLK